MPDLAPFVSRLGGRVGLCELRAAVRLPREWFDRELLLAVACGDLRIEPEPEPDAMQRAAGIRHKGRLLYWVSVA